MSDDAMTQEPGKCSVPMWRMGMPAGSCDKPAWGRPSPCKQYYSYATFRMEREDGKYNGYVPDLACPAHGGPEKPQPFERTIEEAGR